MDLRKIVLRPIFKAMDAVRTGRGASTVVTLLAFLAVGGGAGLALATDPVPRADLVAATAVATPAATQSAAGPSDMAGGEARTASADLLGLSGRLCAIIDTPSALAGGALPATVQSAGSLTPGVHDVGMLTPAGKPFYVLSLLPFAEKTGSALSGYRLGHWPGNASGSRGPRYAPPAGFIEVTRDNKDTHVSDNFRLADFLTHDQASAWPKFLVLRPTLLDKLELISQELERRGLPSRLHVMSGFRSPQYNERGVGRKGGRASRSRHMYGDAADVFVDADGDGRMDDLNGDGAVTTKDGRVLFDAAETVEARYPALVGGLSAYSANSSHGHFVHVDVRGTRARW